MNVCLNCNANENEKPLFTIKFQGSEMQICPQCLPVLIHKPAKLGEKLPGAENFGDPEQHH